MTELTPGANAALPSGDLTVLVRHSPIPGAEIDVSAFLVTETGKVRSDADMCFYGQPSVAGGAGHGCRRFRGGDPVHGCTWPDADRGGEGDPDRDDP